jgi:hypothetical protein
MGSASATLAIAAAVAAVGCRTGSAAAPATVAPATVAPAAVAPAGQPAALDDVTWLAGSWLGDGGGAERAGERWAVDAGRLVGLGYTYERSDCERVPHGTGGMGGSSCAPCPLEPAITEMLEIVERDGVLVYVATPRGQARTDFVITEVGPTHLVAENPAHDFPTRIEYRLDSAAGALHVVASSPSRRLELHLRGR